VKDLYIPDPVEVLVALHGNDELEGRLLAISESESADSKGRFAVVEIAEWHSPVIVPEDRLLLS